MIIHDTFTPSAPRASAYEIVSALEAAQHSIQMALRADNLNGPAYLSLTNQAELLATIRFGSSLHERLHGEILRLREVRSQHDAGSDHQRRLDALIDLLETIMTRDPSGRTIHRGIRSVLRNRHEQPELADLALRSLEIIRDGMTVLD